ncbi:MAG: pilus assembly protein PilM [Desulfobacterota bacterium]|nr:pilus assembly protein PilM [Thermodesulfobacteriota bacterium]MDW8001577.1 pilus assembly protein PilM [Deltaproteobacteria bacterium]
MQILSIDIGSTSVKYVIIRKKGVVRAKGIYPYSGSLDDLPSILADIKEKEGTDFEIRLTITTTEIVKRTFTLPPLPKEELKEAVKWSLPKVLGEPLDTYIFHYGSIGPVDEKGIRREEMYFVGVKREFVERLIGIFEEQGFKNISLITDPLAPYSEIAKALKRERKNFGIIDIGGRLTGLYIFRNNRLSFVREILTAGESFTDSLVMGLGLSFEEAETLKTEKGFTPETEPYLLPPLERLSGELERTINVYNQRYPTEVCEHLYLTGRGSMIPGLEERFKEMLPMSVEPLLLYADVEESFLPAYFVALTKKPEKVLNLLPPEKTEWKRDMRLKRVGIGLSVALATVFLFLSFSLYSKLRFLEINLKAETKLLNEKREFLLRNTGITPGNLSEMGQILSEAKKKNKTFVYLLKAISNLTPERVYLKELAFEKDKTKNVYTVLIKGFAVGEPATIEESLFRFIMLLEKRGILKDIQVSEKRLKESEDHKILEFSLTGIMEERIEV